MHDASHVLTGSTFTHSEPPLVLLASRGCRAGTLFRLTRCSETGGLDLVLRWRHSWSASGESRPSVRSFAGIRLGVVQSGLRLRTTHPSHQPLHPSHRRAVGCPGGRRPAGGWGCRKAARSRSSTGRSWCRRIWPTRFGGSGWRSASPDNVSLPSHRALCDGHHSVRPLFRLDYPFLVSGSRKSLH